MKLAHPNIFPMLLAVVLLLPGSALHAADADKAPERLPEEITITGQKLFRVLEKQIMDAEDHMYAMFNELNDDDQYDIHCHWEARLGTKIKHRECRPKFWDEATAAAGRELLTGTAAPPAAAVGAFHYPKLEQKLKAVLQENPEFLEATMRHHELREELKLRKQSHFDD